MRLKQLNLKGMIFFRMEKDCLLVLLEVGTGKVGFTVDVQFKYKVNLDFETSLIFYLILCFSNKRNFRNIVLIYCLLWTDSNYYAFQNDFLFSQVFHIKCIFIIYFLDSQCVFYFVLNLYLQVSFTLYILTERFRMWRPKTVCTEKVTIFMLRASMVHCWAIFSFQYINVSVIFTVILYIFM